MRRQTGLQWDVVPWSSWGDKRSFCLCRGGVHGPSWDSWALCPTGSAHPLSSWDQGAAVVAGVSGPPQGGSDMQGRPGPGLDVLRASADQ